nr:putative ribonuclease H-like domain-containing protein [Tanacetum cinerariifolium]
MDAGTNSTNLSGIKDAANQEVKKDVSSLKYIVLPNWAHDDLLEFSSFPTACLNNSQEPSSEARLISKRVANPEETPSLDNILSLTNRFEDTLGVTTSSDEIIRVEADVSNMETSISASPTPTLRIQKDHPKSQIIGVRPIGTKWVLKNKRDKKGIVVRNKAMLVAQGQTQEERINYDKVFAPVARIEAIRLFLAFMGFTVYQMDVKSAFLYGTIDEEVYVMHPPGFQDPAFLAKVYKVEKAMYGLHQAPRAWYGTLSKYLLKNGFQRGTIDQTLFIKMQRKDFILVQVYVDDIIFGSSNPQLCREFEALMHEKFQMSVMGELNFFLGLQVLQKEDGIFLSHDKYIGDILKKFGFLDVRSSNTPMDKDNPWGKERTGKDIELHLYRSMIGSLMYLTASRPDIMFAVCACARHQVTPKECHLHAVKRIFRYLKGHPKLGLWYPKASPFDLVAYSDSDYGGASQDRKSTTRGSQFLGRREISVLSGPDIMFVVCACVRYHVNPKVSHLYAVKRNFRAFKRVNTFVDYRTELVEESSKKSEEEVTSSKRARTKLEQESVKKQKIDDDKDTAELQQLVKIIPDEKRVAIDAVPLAVKPPSIVGWKI